MKLANQKYNPTPANPVVGEAKTRDGITLRYAHWRTTNPPTKGTVILLHGRAEYIEKLFETVGDLREQGFDVLTFDWRGQGGSQRLLDDRRRGFVEQFDQYIQSQQNIIDTSAENLIKVYDDVIANFREEIDEIGTVKSLGEIVAELEDRLTELKSD